MLKNASPEDSTLAPSHTFVKTRVSISMLTLAPSPSEREGADTRRSSGATVFFFRSEIQIVG